MNSSQYVGRKIVILGMGRQGVALARFFLAQGAQVTVSDVRPEHELAAACAGLRSAKEDASPALRFVLGGHPPELLEGADLLCLSGGVSPQIPIVREAVARGIPLSNDALLTLRHCPVPVVGITGSAGKTTTTTLVGLMLEAAGYTVHVGGNIGTPLLDRLGTIGPGDKVVMELSSFQLELFDGDFRRPQAPEEPATWRPPAPAIAAILNITPNHLDRHPSMSHYTAAKANILRHQEPGDTCVLNADDRVTGPWLASGRCQIEAGPDQSLQGGLDTLRYSTSGAARPLQGAPRPLQGAARPLQGAARPLQGAARPLQGASRPDFPACQSTGYQRSILFGGEVLCLQTLPISPWPKWRQCEPVPVWPSAPAWASPRPIASSS